MSKLKKLLFVTLGVVFCVGFWLLRSSPHERLVKVPEPKEAMSPSGHGERKGIGFQQESPGIGNLAVAMAAIEEFDTVLNKLRNKSGEEWLAGLLNLTKVVNHLAKRSDFESRTAAALMIKRISDLAIGGLMAGEVDPIRTGDVLNSIDYQMPSDQELIALVGQYYPDAWNEHKRNPSSSVFELLSKFEPEITFPADKSAQGKIIHGMITERNATLSLMSIAWAKPQLELARVTAIYLARGGNSTYRGEDLEKDLRKRVGQEILSIKPPMFASEIGNMNPTATDITSAITNAARDFKEQN